MRYLSWRGGLLLVCLACIGLRAPSLLIEPRFWAEEGTRYFAYAWQVRVDGQWWLALVNAPTTLSVGYFGLWPNLASTLAAMVPLEWAPTVTTVAALVVQVSVAAFWLWSRFELWPEAWQKGLGLVLLLVTPLTAEAWLNTINSQSFFVVLTLLVLLATPEPGRGRWTARVALAVAGLTSSVSCVLTPWFLERAWSGRERERWIQAAILGAAALIQLGVALQSSGAAGSLIGQRHGLPSLSTLVAVWSTQSIGLVLGGIAWMRTEAAWIVAHGGLSWGWTLVWLVAVVAAIIGVTQGLPPRDRGRVISIYCGLLTVVVTASLGDDKLALVPPGVAERYFLAPNMLLALTLLAAVGTGTAAHRQGVGRWRRWGQGLVLVWVIVHGSARYAEQPFVRADWPRWSDEVAHWRSDPSQPLHVWPGDWTIAPPPRPDTRDR